MSMVQTRRQFLTRLSLAGAAGLVRAPPLQAAEGPLEIKSVRIPKYAFPVVCVAPTEIAGEMLRAEGFTDVRYVETPLDAIEEMIARGDIDFGQNFAADHVAA